jgi:hypothetical protein
MLSSIIFVLKKQLFLILLFFLLAENAFALWMESTGDISAVMAYTEKPSSLKDQSAYRVPLGILGLQLGFEEGMKAITELSYGRTRDTTGRAQLQVEKLYVQVDGLISENGVMQFGQLPNPWVGLMERESPMAFYLGASYQPIVIHWNELNRADSGFAFVQNWSASQLEISITNGEGPGQDEKGPRKELQIFYQTQLFDAAKLDQRWLLAFGAIEGGYENIEASISQKERLLVFIKYEVLHKSWGSLELISSKDPVDGVNLKVADQVDLTDLGGLVTRGSGGALELGSWLSEKSAVQLRCESFNPAQGVDGRGLSSEMLGFHFFPRQHLQFSLAWVQVQYGQNHSASVRDSEEVALGAKLRWP